MRSVKGGGLYGVQDRVDRRTGEVGMGIVAVEEGRETISIARASAIGSGGIRGESMGSGSSEGVAEGSSRGGSGCAGDMRGSCLCVVLVGGIRVAHREPCALNSPSGYCLCLID